MSPPLDQLSSLSISGSPSNNASRRTVNAPNNPDDDGDGNNNNNAPALHPASTTTTWIPIPDRKAAHFTSRESAMADPFEVRMRFTSQLQHLNASVTSSQKAAQYALRYKDMDEDLHSCILEQLEKNSMNNRANILYFLESLADLSATPTHAHPDYIRMMQRDILRIVDAVTPEDGSGAANTKVVHTVLGSLAAKGHLQPQTVDEIGELLRERDTSGGLGGGESGGARADDGMDVDGGEAAAAAWRAREELRERERDAGGGVRLDKKLVEQRIEEDRERHKRLREQQWAVPGGGGEEEDDAEFEMLYEETSSVGSDDYALFEEEAAERGRCAAEHGEEVEGVGAEA